MQADNPPSAYVEVVHRNDVGEGIYGFLDYRNLLREEQKGYRKKGRGTHDLLFIDKMVVRQTIGIWQ